MSPVVAVCSALALAVGPVLALAVAARLRFTRRFASFRCRPGPSAWRPHRRRWQLLRTRAAWAGGVLLVRSGPFHLGVTPVVVGVPRTSTVRRLDPGEVRGVGLHPVSLRFTTEEGRVLELAVAGDRAAQLAGPFLTLLLPDLPPAPRDMDA
jgi:hypothetical protein